MLETADIFVTVILPQLSIINLDFVVHPVLYKAALSCTSTLRVVINVTSKARFTSNPWTDEYGKRETKNERKFSSKACSNAIIGMRLFYRPISEHVLE